MLNKLKTSFASVDLRSVAAFRITLSIVLVLDLLINRLPGINVFYVSPTLISVDSVLLFSKNIPLSVFYYVDGLFGVSFVFILYFIFCVCLLFGVRTKIVSVILFYLLFSIQERTAPFLFGADYTLSISLVWSCFLPLNDRFSIHNKKKIESDHLYIGLPVLGFLLQISYVYFFGSILKSGETWSDGSAVSYALSIFQGKTDLSNWLLEKESLTKLLTYCVKWFEFLIPFLIFSPFKNKQTRLIAAFLILCFHIGLSPFLNVGTFYLSTLPFVCFLIPSFIWDKAFAYFSRND